jgi:lysophospholipase L1-like esterase
MTSFLSEFTKDRPCNIVCIGDSNTYGHGDTGHTGGWPFYLGRSLGTRYGNISKVFNLGIGGEKTADVVGRLGEASLRQPDLLIVAVGVNDARSWVNRPNLGPETSENGYRLEVANLLTRAQSVCPRVLVLAPMEVDEQKIAAVVTDGARWETSTVWRYSRILAELCQQADVAFLDLYTELSTAIAPPKRFTDYLDDGLHPNAAGYQIVAALVEKRVEAMLSLQHSAQRMMGPRVAVG